MRSKYNVTWFLIAILLPYTNGSMFEGDACTMKSTTGVCTLASECPELEAAVKSGRFSTRDIVNCGYTAREEIICCPGRKNVTTDNRQAITTTTTTATTTTTMNPIESTSTDFWEYLLTTTPKMTDIVPTTTTTAKPDFWLHLLNSTTSTTTAKPDFWLHLIETTTSTTTPPPLIINGKKLDTDAGFIDLNEILSQREQESNNSEDLPNNQEPRIPSRQIPDSVDDRGFGWHMQRPQQFQPGPPINFRPNSGMPFREDSRNHRQGHRSQWNAGEINFFPQPNQNHQPTFNQRPFGQQNTNFRPQSRTVLNGPMNRFPNTNTAFQKPFNNVWNGPQRNTNFELQPSQQWQNNLIAPTNNFVENFGPNIYEQQNSALMQEPKSNRWPNSNTNSNSLPNHQIWPENNNVRFPNNFHNQETDDRNPIALINENLKNSGFDIVSATENDDQHKNGFSNEIFNEVSPKITTPTRTPVFDMDAPFKFRPQPTDDGDRRVNENWSQQQGSKDFRFPGAVANRPTWNSDLSNDDVDPITPRTTKRTTTTTTTISPFPTRTKDRPAVIACREIDEGLDPALTPHILDGTPVELREFPHMVAIGFSDIGNDQGPYDFRCGGTLIAKRFVLTAAHCVNSRESKPSIVLLGLVNLKNEEERKEAQEIRVKEVHIYPDYASSRTYHDVAILELEREVTFSDLAYPTCLYTDLNDPPQSSSLFVTGWGTINTGTRETSDILLKAKLDIVSVSQCNESFVQMGLNRRIANGVVNTQLCAHDPGFKRDACQGDSGGPLNLIVDESLKKYRIVGIVSAGFSCGSATPGLYTRVASYLDYIESIVWPHLA